MTDRRTAQGFLDEYLEICQRWQCSIEAEVDPNTGTHLYNEVYLWDLPLGHLDSALAQTKNELLVHLPIAEEGEEEEETEEESDD